MVMCRHMQGILRKAQILDGRKRSFHEKSHASQWPNPVGCKFGSETRRMDFGNQRSGIANNAFTTASATKYAALYEKKVSQPSFGRAKRDWSTSHAYALNGMFPTNGAKMEDHKLLEMAFRNHSPPRSDHLRNINF